MALYTKKINLIETTEQEFRRRTEFWKKDRLRLRYQTIPTTIENPVVMLLISSNPAKDYATLFEMLLDHPNADQLCVQSSGRWIKKYKEGLDSTQLNAIAAFAAADDENQEKTNYLEMKYKDPEIDLAVRAGHPFHRPVIRFAETEFGGGRALVGYQMHFPTEYQHLFTVNLTGTRADLNLVRGLWVP